MLKQATPVFFRQLYHPHPALRPFVESYCVLTPSRLGVGRVPWHIMPDGAAYVLLHIYRNGTDTSFHSRLAFVGPRSTYIFTNRKQRILSLIARLRPGIRFLPALHQLAELQDQAVLLEDLTTHDLSVAQEEMTDLGASHQIDALVQNFDVLILRLLDQQIKQNPLVCEAVQIIDETGGDASIQCLSSQLGVSSRHLRSVFNKWVGLSPKRYARVV